MKLLKVERTPSKHGEEIATMTVQIDLSQDAVLHKAEGEKVLLDLYRSAIQTLLTTTT